MVVGVDGSSAGVAALAWALDLAAEQGAEVDVVTAWPDSGQAFVHAVPGHYCVPLGAAVEVLEAALAATRAGERKLPALRSHLENADPADALLLRARGADLLVVGASVSPEGRLVRHVPIDELCVLLADCPVVVIEPRQGRRPEPESSTFET